MEPTPRPYVSDSSAPNGRLDKRPRHLLAKQHSSGSVKTSQREKQAVGYPVVLICCWNPLVKCEFSMHFWPETGPSDQLYSSEDSHYWQRAVPSYQHSVLWCISWKVKPCPAESNIHRTGHHTWQSAVNRQPWRPGAWMDLSSLGGAWLQKKFGVLWLASEGIVVVPAKPVGVLQIFGRSFLQLCRCHVSPC